MKFLCDVHISIKLSKRIEQLGFSSEHVNNVLDRWHTRDEVITDYVDQHDMILITKDNDFRNSFLLNQKPKKLIKINLGNLSNKELIALFESNLNRILELNQQTKSFMIEVNKDNFWTIIK